MSMTHEHAADVIDALSRDQKQDRIDQLTADLAAARGRIAELERAFMSLGALSYQEPAKGVVEFRRPDGRGKFSRWAPVPGLHGNLDIQLEEWIRLAYHRAPNLVEDIGVKPAIWTDSDGIQYRGVEEDIPF